MKPHRVLALVLALVLVLPLFPFPARAEEPAEKHNIVIVVDSGGSLKKGIISDPDEYRFQAIRMFFDLLNNNGDYMCVVDFKGNNKPNDSSDRAMRELIRCFPEDGLKEVTGPQDKEAMIKFLEHDAGGYSDIGTALLVAAELLDGKTAENGLDSYIYLFTDGQTEFKDGAPKAYHDKSLENQNKALEMIRENDITLCAAYLDHGNQNARDVAQIVLSSMTDDEDKKAAITDEDLKQMGRYERVTSAADLPAVFQNFFTRLSSASKRDLSRTDTFTIPGTCTDGVRLCINTEQDEETVKYTRITSLVHSEHGEVPLEELFDCRSTGGSYVIYTLPKLESGQYQIKWESPDPNARCEVILDMDLTAGISLKLSPEEITYKAPFAVEGWLSRQGEQLTSSSKYSGFRCTLEVYERNSGTLVSRQEAFHNEDGLFSATYLPDYFGALEARIVFTCEDVSICSERVAFNVENYPPVVKDASKGISTSFGGKGVRELELADYISDAEDQQLEKLTITPAASNTYPKEAFELSADNRTLTIRGREGGSGTLVLHVADSHGRYAEWTLQIKVRNNTVLFLLLLLALAAAAVAGWFRLQDRRKASLVLSGTVTITLKFGLSPCTIKLDVMECLHKHLYEVLSCRKNRLIHIFSETPNFRNRAQSDIESLLIGNRTQLRSYRLIAFAVRNGPCELRLVGPDAPERKDSKEAPGVLIEPNSVKDTEIKLKDPNSLLIHYQKA